MFSNNENERNPAGGQVDVGTFDSPNTFNVLTLHVYVVTVGPVAAPSAETGLLNRKQELSEDKSNTI